MPRKPTGVGLGNEHTLPSIWMLLGAVGSVEIQQNQAWEAIEVLVICEPRS